MKGAYSHYFGFKFYYQVSKKVVIFLYNNSLNLNCSQKDIGVKFFCRAPFQFNDYPSDKHNVKKVVDYDVPHTSNINDDWVYPCCGLSKLEKWEVHYHSCTDVTQPYRWQLLKSETAFCNIFHKNCISPTDFVSHQEHVHLCLPSFVCPICHFTYIAHSCLWMHITESHGGPETAISLI